MTHSCTRFSRSYPAAPLRCIDCGEEPMSTQSKECAMPYPVHFECKDKRCGCECHVHGGKTGEFDAAF